MEKTLRELQEYQVNALRKGIAYDLEVFINDERVPDIQVRMFYSVAGDILDNRNFKTTFSNDDKLADVKLERIRKFIDNIETEQ